MYSQGSLILYYASKEKNLKKKKKDNYGFRSRETLNYRIISGYGDQPDIYL